MKYEQDQSYFNPKARWVETALKSVQSVLQAWCPMCPSQAFKYDLNSMPKTLSTKSSKQLSKWVYNFWPAKNLCIGGGQQQKICAKSSSL